MKLARAAAEFGKEAVVQLINDQWYYLPDGMPVQARAVGTGPDWYLLSDPRGVTCYGVYAFGWRQFIYDRELGEYHGVACQLTLTDLRPAEWNAAALWQARTEPAHVTRSRARRHARPRV
jgi:hypothetical protein